MERVARFADYENEVIETPRRKRGAAAVIYDININININIIIIPNKLHKFRNS